MPWALGLGRAVQGLTTSTYSRFFLSVSNTHFLKRARMNAPLPYDNANKGDSSSDGSDLPFALFYSNMIQKFLEALFTVQTERFPAHNSIVKHVSTDHRNLLVIGAPSELPTQYPSRRCTPPRQPGVVIQIISTVVDAAAKITDNQRHSIVNLTLTVAERRRRSLENAYCERVIQQGDPLLNDMTWLLWRFLPYRNDAKTVGSGGVGAENKSAGGEELGCKEIGRNFEL
ncbi:hypothetical protein BJ912DRAFT_937633 [Pholiota molesta]|nr:hypothetical protein BJ912DRAFT_937633 [Pholiota molesta]